MFTRARHSTRDTPKLWAKVFVHISAVERSGLTGLADNQKVGYELQDGRDGRHGRSRLSGLLLESLRGSSSKAK